MSGAPKAPHKEVMSVAEVKKKAEPKYECLADIPQDQILKRNDEPKGQPKGIVGVVTVDGRKYYLPVERPKAAAPAPEPVKAKQPESPNGKK